MWYCRPEAAAGGPSTVRGTYAKVLDRSTFKWALWSEEQTGSNICWTDSTWEYPASDTHPSNIHPYILIRNQDNDVVPWGEKSSGGARSSANHGPRGTRPSTSSLLFPFLTFSSSSFSLLGLLLFHPHLSSFSLWMSIASIVDQFVLQSLAAVTVLLTNHMQNGCWVERSRLVNHLLTYWGRRIAFSSVMRLQQWLTSAGNPPRFVLKPPSWEYDLAPFSRLNMGSTHSTNGPLSSLRYIPQSYNHADSQASALRLVLTLNPHWEGPGNQIEFVRFTDGITNTVRDSIPILLDWQRL